MILVDANAICHQAKHSMGSMSWNEKQTGVIFGFFSQIITLARTMGTNDFAFVWDSRESLRTQIYPEYKKARRKEKTPDERQLDEIAYIQFNAIRDEILPMIGFVNSYMIDGYEADDLAASIIKNNPQHEYAIISSDEDLYQLLAENVYMYSTKKKQSFTIKNLWKDYGITPAQWVEVKAMGGCTSDGIPGISGVGEITACKYLTRRLSFTSKAYRSIRESKELIDFNRKLVKLPFEGTPPIVLLPKVKLNFRSFMNMCNEHGFRSFLERERLNQWKQLVFTEV